MKTFFYSLCFILYAFLTAGITNAIFVDVDTTHPYFHGIDYLEQEGILKGYQKGELKYFRPLQEINRVEGLKILLLASETELSEDTRFITAPDVSKKAWYTSFVSTALSLDIAKGYQDGKFHPENKITLAEFLKMLILTFDIGHESLQSGEKWFTPFLERAQELHIVTSPQDPSHIVTRGEASEMVFRTINVILNDYKPYVFSGSGIASYYNEGFAGKLTASGEIYDPFDLTAAHRVLPFDTKVRVINDENGQSVVVRINDRGPYHKQRVIDLSQRAFEALAPISKGVLKIRFEVLSDPSQEAKKPTIPEFIRPALQEEENRQPTTPDYIRDKIIEEKPSLLGETIEEKILGEQEALRDPAPSPINFIDHGRAIFNHTISHIPQDFYPNATLRKSIPQTIALGTVIKLSGMAEQVHQEATLFIHDPVTGEQQKFVGRVDGKTFNFPIAFLEPGEFQMGLVFDDENKSRVAEIEVIDHLDTRRLPSNMRTYEENYAVDVRTVPEEEVVYLSFVTPANHMAKIVFNQGEQMVKMLYFEDGVSSFAVPYSFFKDFNVNEILAMDLYFAPTNHRTLATQAKQWIKVYFKNFLLISGFTDSESSILKVPGFKRFYNDLQSIALDVRLRDANTQLRDVVYLTTPEGLVQEIPLESLGNGVYKTFFRPETFGTYVFEVLSTDGGVLFNRAIYIYKDWVLPVYLWPNRDITNDSPATMRHWINTFRAKHGRSALGKSLELDNFAQAYAERMARENFVGHTDPQGNSFQDRVLMADLTGTGFGENVGFGTTLQLALDGLENSGSHRKNMLEAKWTKVGMGITTNVEGEYYVVQIFGK